ncbi:GNAT family N-acetyltransferase (plasmid) [Halorarum halophilum]|uniref:GNAT family N-acetyltransferase n=1 Tax=Halorarum halophilum TaxID=2743090 RepID=A0A7D5GKD8_9EURY|nr:GNAT family N-acetyltransferase [Halobaculum halophilum]QLG29711.1 GNAT family N-acetyltransferase [Halobaculum halophilum]
MENALLGSEFDARPPDSSSSGDHVGSRSLPTWTAIDGRDRELAFAAIEYASWEEIDGVVAMYDDFEEKHAAQGLPPRKGDDIREWLTALRCGLHVVARHDGRTVGHATLVSGEESDVGSGSGDEREAGHELAIFVHQDYRNAGVGTHLLRTLLSYAGTVGVERVWLMVERHNRAAIALYDDVGFETVEVSGGTVEMELDLDESAVSRLPANPA